MGVTVKKTTGHQKVINNMKCVNKLISWQKLSKSWFSLMTHSSLLGFVNSSHDSPSSPPTIAFKVGNSLPSVCVGAW